MSGWVDVHYQALEECGKRARKVANMLDLDDAFEGTKSSAPTGQTSSKTFGALKDSGDLATDVDKVWRALEEELQAGKSRLNSVEKAIDQVETNLRKAAKASGG
ncbi:MULTISPECIES: hypothetical protein [Nonomuraea]|uniref:Uncharacterized protein n=1 Tax=Nonomuraea guangzhouensis TaxID=1291555 RepID=A0ABW4GI92_9ACTN|nr:MULTISPECIES: hypothetical protein [Nonomuraea]MBT2224511.1 hypothetical protein [Nonomuraea sp. NEAU-A123]